jgi:hypothetical protein
MYPYFKHPQLPARKSTLINNKAEMAKLMHELYNGAGVEVFYERKGYFIPPQVGRQCVVSWSTKELGELLDA